MFFNRAKVSHVAVFIYTRIIFSNGQPYSYAQQAKTTQLNILITSHKLSHFCEMCSSKRTLRMNGLRQSF